MLISTDCLKKKQIDINFLTNLRIFGSAFASSSPFDLTPFTSPFNKEALSSAAAFAMKHAFNSGIIVSSFTVNVSFNEVYFSSKLPFDIVALAVDGWWFFICAFTWVYVFASYGHVAQQNNFNDVWADATCSVMYLDAASGNSIGFWHKWHQMRGRRSVVVVVASWPGGARWSPS